MRHRVHTFKVGRRTGHREAMLANAVCSLIQHGRITTTLVKAKEVRRVADKIMTFAKEGTLHARRLAIAELHQVGMVCKLFNELAPNYATRQGGYTRLMKIGPRIGDGAEMCIVELVETDAQVQAKNAPAAEAPAAEAAAPVAVEASAEEAKGE